VGVIEHENFIACTRATFLSYLADQSIGASGTRKCIRRAGESTRRRSIVRVRVNRGIIYRADCAHRSHGRSRQSDSKWQCSRDHRSRHLKQWIERRGDLDVRFRKQNQTARHRSAAYFKARTFVAFETVVCEDGWLRLRVDRYADVSDRAAAATAETERWWPNCAECNRNAVTRTTRSERRAASFGFGWNSVRVYGRGFTSRAGVFRGKMSCLDYLDLCRLCLVKNDVSVPIFEGEGDVRQIYFKIAACLPVKVRSQLRRTVQLWRSAILCETPRPWANFAVARIAFVQILDPFLNHAVHDSHKRTNYTRRIIRAYPSRALRYAFLSLDETSSALALWRR